jgi:hypothetical protein
MRSAADKVLRRARRWLRQPDHDHSQPPSFEGDASVYPKLNWMFEKMRAQHGERFRPSYAWCTLHAAHLAKSLGIPRISVIEFGVATGKGLLALEAVAAQAEAWLGVGIDVYGFDGAVGLPGPMDYRDLPNLYRQGDLLMDVERLESRLTRAHLILGDVSDTVPEFLAADPSPIGFISVDLDLYSSSVHALKVLLAQDPLILPRVHCYFDDILGYTFAEHNGERLAMAEFNAANEDRKISPIYGLAHFVPQTQRFSVWPEKIYLAHALDHPRYGESDGLWHAPVRTVGGGPSDRP